ncbi:MAG TPA: zf-HC2 domain-containing protein [Gemmatimonadales bacterium]|jgi:hypothetical protein|nr:zf-HC2 domain-containing protein [Gemmatimonadales bacterium]
MHLDQEQIQRLLHRELPAGVEASLREHLAGCGDCRGRLQSAERTERVVQGLLRRLDHPVPRVDARTIEAMAGAPRWSEWSRWAAGILIVLGGVTVAYAVPGSPLRDWVRTLTGRVNGGPARAPAPPIVPAPQAGTGGIAVVPGPRLVIQFTSSQVVGQVRVSLGDRDEVVVEGPSGGARFTTEAGRLVIDNPGSSATFEIEIPREAPWVEIRVERRRIFLKAGPRVTTESGAAVQGVYRISLAPPRG